MLDRVINNKIIWIILGLILIGLIIGMFVIQKKDKYYYDEDITIYDDSDYTKKYEEELNIVLKNFELKGTAIVNLIIGDEYEELGFIAISVDGEDLSDYVEIVDNVDTTKEGTYTVKYIYTYKDFSKEIERDVIVKEKSLPKLELIGDSTLYLNKGEEYIEEGIQAYLNDIDKSDEVIVSGSVNNNIVGTYTLRYTYQDLEVTRDVVVIDIDTYFEVLENAINVRTSDYIKYIKMPDGSINTDKVVSLNILKNGVYEFYLYTLNDKEYKKEITISNIATNATCKAILYDGKTTITVESNDTDIVSYNYNDYETISDKTYKIDKFVRNPYVTLISKMGINEKIVCSTEIQSLPVKKPSGTIKYKAESDTLKVYVKEKSGWWLSYIWALDPVNQLNKQMVTSKSLSKPNDLLTKAIKSKSLKNKIVIGFNASSMLDNGKAYGTNLIKKYPIYAYKERSPLLLYNGKVVINDYENYPVNQVIYYLDGSNQLRYVPKLKSKTKEERKQIFQDVIDSGARNTMHFAPVLIENGKVNEKAKLDGADYNAYRQAICQVDSNNFILITSHTAKKGPLLTFAKYIKNTLKLDCKTVYNLDGGGSTSLFFKKRGTNSLTTLTNFNRSTSTIMYFTE